MNTYSFDKKLHKGRLFGTLRRAVAGALTAAMLLPMVPTFGAADTEMAIHPVQDTDYRPDIEIQSNFVRDEFGFLTGYMELGLRVKTGEKDPFRYLAVSLEYDTELFTPVDWESPAEEIEIKNVTGTTTPKQYQYYSEMLPAQKEEHITMVRAYAGIPDTAAAGVTNEVKDGRHALFSFWAGATGVGTSDGSNVVDGVIYKEMTTIAVIRFKVNEDEMEHFSIKKNSTNTGYDIFYNDVQVTNVVQLQAEMNKPVPNKWGKSVEFADDGDIYITKPDTQLALEYRAGSVRLDATGSVDQTNGTLYDRRYYYLPDYDATQNLLNTSLVLEGHTYTVDRPNYRNLLAPAVKAGSAVGDPDRFSYLTNLIVDKVNAADGSPDHYYVTFPVVTDLSFMAGEDMLDKLTTIVYVDWDNTLLGTQIVPQNTDVRTLVSDYVAENFIYHDTDDTTYGLNDLNNPNDPLAAKDLGGTDMALDIVKSLDRLYNYRGKYPADGPAADNTTNSYTVDDKTTVDLNGDRILPLGAEYPLTNKLDYVFFKRPMGHDAATEPDPTTYPNGANDPQYLADKATWENTWIQPSSYNAASNAYTIEYDVERPFAYGWAKCTVDNYEDVWTTLGMGELSSYSGSTNGGYLAQTGGAKVTVDGEAGSQLVFADLKTGFKTGEKTVFLKAVYEPGTELMSGDIFYRMIKAPYYNKLNYGAASRGGAYSSDVTFERATTDVKVGDTGNKVRGVARMREPYVRQDVTTDLMWEENTTLGVNHDLPNADMTSTYTDKDKTTYIKIDVANTDIISFSLTLSARQNKVDYYLIEGYNTNFVAGGARTDNDSTRSVPAATLDNYNYFVDGESDLADVWYDAPYKDRDGSRGFVLTGTLNQIMEQATRCYNGEMTTMQLSTTYATSSVLMDMNIRKSDGTFPGLLDTQALVQQIVNAAGAAQTAHLGGNDAYWNTERNCAQLTYHQLQGYILNSSLNHPETPVTGLTWCHLHKACADAGANKPTDWASLITAAGTPGTLGGMSLILNDLNTLAYLRKDGSGTPFATLNEYISALETAVAALGATPTPSWDAVQAQIVGNGDTAADGPTKYWWYDSLPTVTSLPKGSWSDLLGLAKDAVTAPVIPGETAATAQKRLAKLGQVKDAYDSNAYVTGTDTNWIAVTENLCANNNGGKFGSFSGFTTALTNALTAYAAPGPNQTTAPDWYQVQYYVLNGTTAAPSGDAAAPSDYATYWWHNGGQKVTDLATLLQAARDANSGNAASLNALTVADLYNTSYTELFFGKDYKGTRYTAADLDSFRNLVKSYVQVQGCNDTWDQLQYYVISGGTCDLTSTSTLLDVNNKQTYFWWKANGTGTAVTFSTTVKGNVTALLKAAYASGVTGDPKAWDNLTDPTIKNYRLIKTDDASTDFNDFPKFGPADLGDFKAYMEDLVDALITAAGEDTLPMPNAPNATWYQVQYAALHSGALVTGSSIPDNTVYWWLQNDTNIDPLAEFEKLLDNAYKRGTNAITIPQFQATITPDLLTTMGFTMPGNVAITAANVGPIKSKLQNLYARANTMGLVSGGKINVTWYQVQWMARTGALLPAATAKTQLNNQGVTAPTWATNAGYSLRPMNAMLMAPAAPTVETILSEDGLTETTKTTTKTWNGTTGYEDTTIVTQVVTRVPNGETTTVITTTTTVTTIINEETWEPVTTSATETTVTEELAMPETPLAPLPIDPYEIDSDTDVIETTKPIETDLVGTDDPNEFPAESTVTPEETPDPGAGDKTEPAEDEEGTVGAGSKPAQSSAPAEDEPETGETDAAGVGSKPAQDAAPTENDPETGGSTTDPPGDDEPSTDPPDPGGGERAKSLALARARLRLKPLSLISIRRTKAPPPLISIFTPNSSAGRALL